MAKRSFAGYLCEENLTKGIFGESFRAVNKKGVEVRIVVLDSQLSNNVDFAGGLARFSGGLAELIHENLVTTRTVGRGKDGNLVVICSPVKTPTLVSELIGDSKSIPESIALGICMGVLRGLAYAHQKGVVHGGVHPQSVLVDGGGVAHLGDFGLAHALTAAAVSPENSKFLGGLRGYVAPEITLGGAPEIESDVYAISVLFCRLLWQSETPKASAPTALVNALRRGLQVESDKRVKNAGILLQELELVLEVAGLDIASNERVASFVSGTGGAEAIAADAAAAAIAGLSEHEVIEISEPEPMSLESVLGEAEDEVTRIQSFSDVDEDLPTAELIRKTEIERQSDSALASLESDSVLASLEMEADEEAQSLSDSFIEEATKVDVRAKEVDMPPADAATRSSEIEKKAAELSRALDLAEASAKPQPEISIEPVAENVVVDDATPLPAPRPFHADGSHHDGLVDDLGRHAAINSPFDDADDLPDAESARFKNLRLVALMTFSIAILFAIAYTMTDFFKAAESEKRSEEEKLAEAAELRQPRAGHISIESETADAAVWLLIGRTPTSSFPLSSSMIHELRFDREGYKSSFASVSGQHWSGKDKERKAEFQISLQALIPGEATSILPAFPPALERAGVVSGPGQGVVEINSQPEGAEVWLLVGTTPASELQGVAAGRDYEFKIQKDGFVPAIAIVKEDDWYLSGKDGPIRAHLTRKAKLEPLPKGADKSDGKKTKRIGPKRQKKDK